MSFMAYIKYRIPVSYTHLDVYKRQLYGELDTDLKVKAG